jgi:hypothetical protein
MGVDLMSKKTAFSFSNGVPFVEKPPKTALGYKDYGDVMIDRFPEDVPRYHDYNKSESSIGMNSATCFWPDMSDEKIWDE